MMRNSIPCLGIIHIRCKGFDLSLSFIPFGKGTPIGIGGKNTAFFGTLIKKCYFCLSKQKHTRCRLIDLDIIGWIHG